MSTAIASNNDTHKSTTGDDDGPVLSTVVKEDEDKKARQLLKEIEFDPNHINKVCRVKNPYYMITELDEEMDIPQELCWFVVTPMIYFCYVGNLTMCRYLLSRGADCTKPSTCQVWFPLYAAALGGKLDVCRWLVRYGGLTNKDIRKQNSDGFTPLCSTIINPPGDNEIEIAMWLIRHGALFRDDTDEGDRDDGELDDTTMRDDLLPNISYCNQWTKGDERLKLLSAAQDALTRNERVQLFLKGTLLKCRPSSSNHRYETRSSVKRRQLESSLSSPLVIFNGQSDILELIGEYAENPMLTPKDVRTLHQFVDRLSAFIDDTPFWTS